MIYSKEKVGITVGHRFVNVDVPCLASSSSKSVCNAKYLSSSHKASIRASSSDKL